MNKTAFYILSVLLLFASCATDRQAKLEELKAKRDDLNAQIAALEKEIEEEGGKLNGENQKIVSVKTQTIKKDVFKHYLEVQGTIESDNNIFVPAQSGGIVTRIFVKEGDKVRKGQVMAQLDGSIYQRQIESMNSQLALAKTAYERQKRLWDQKIGSEMQYLQAKTQKESLQKQIEALREQYRLTLISSPISGTVDEVKIKEGESAAPGFGAIRVVQLSELKITASLSESYISSVHEDDTVKVRIPSIDKEFEQPIEAVSKVIDPNNRTFNIELKVPKDIKDIKPNMVAVLTINDYTNTGAIVIPLNAMQKTGDDNQVFVIQKNSSKTIAERRSVEPGKYSNDKVEIVNGIEPGEEIITFGFTNLSDKQEVMIENGK